MTDRYSIYDAKAKLSAIVRQVREGRSAVITVHGEPVAEIRPYVRSKETVEERFDRWVAEGRIVPAKGRGRLFPVAGEPSPGALERFLADRDED